MSIRPTDITDALPDDLRVAAEDYRAFLAVSRTTVYGDLSKYVSDQECYLFAEWLTTERPEFAQAAGFYVRPDGRPGDHAWNVTADGTIVDTTAVQHEPGHPLVITAADVRYDRYVSYTDPRIETVLRALDYCSTCLSAKPVGDLCATPDCHDWLTTRPPGA